MKNESEGTVQFYQNLDAKVHNDIDNLRRSLKKYPVHDKDTFIEKVEP